MPDRPGAIGLSILTGDLVELAGQQAGERSTAPPFVLLHGLTATHRYVVMGSRVLEQAGQRVIAYDARGHGRSTPASEHGAYGYKRLKRDLLAVLDSLDIERAILAGASMGAHTIVSFALRHPERVAGLGLITPAFDPAADTHMPDAYAGWDALAHGLSRNGVEGFLAAYDFSTVPDTWRPTVEAAVRQRLSAHEHPDAVADALETVPRSRPFERIEELSAVRAPTLVIASRDEADPGHPFALGELYAQTIPGARLIVEDEGQSPLAWQGGQLSKALLSLAGESS